MDSIFDSNALGQFGGIRSHARFLWNEQSVGRMEMYLLIPLLLPKLRDKLSSYWNTHWSIDGSLPSYYHRAAFWQTSDDLISSEASNVSWYVMLDA